MRNAPGRSLVAAALAALLAVSSGWAEDAKRTRPARSAQKKRQNRERWEKLDKAKRQEIQKLFRQLRRPLLQACPRGRKRQKKQSQTHHASRIRKWGTGRRRIKKERLPRGRRCRSEFV